MKYYNIELTRERAECLQWYLLDNDYKHEISAAAYGMYHFEILLTPDQAAEVDNWIKTTLYADAIRIA